MIALLKSSISSSVLGPSLASTTKKMARLSSHSSPTWALALICANVLTLVATLTSLVTHNLGKGGS